MTNSGLEERKVVELRNRELTLTPLDLLDMRLLEKIGMDLRAKTITPRDAILQSADIIFRSAQVAEPSLTSEDVLGCLTIRNFPRAMNALMEVSGLVVDGEPAEEKKTEEDPVSGSIGAKSTAL